jgi:hypothetical protein
VTHILHEGLPEHMLDEGHDEGSICTCPRWSDCDVPKFLEDVIKDIKWLLLLDIINQIPLIGWHGGCITNPQSQCHPQHLMQSTSFERLPGGRHHESSSYAGSETEC